ncbi:hypothetical protein DPMN_174590 [Dreissena polymorpha]|uniref:Uncharacterized protein n=1 Tax=Dreissena polymorpha TaxID=45954 RepID=A0A9D4E3N4_DREPO|nr:hypothetical protein DPMN_174590 [Dreissena polymorpha]
MSDCRSTDAKDFFGKNAVFRLPFLSHQRPGLWRSARPHGVLNTSLASLPRSYCVLTATKADHTASERRPWRFYCDLIATIASLQRPYVD